MRVIEKINETNPDFVWIGLGAPKQEKWMFDHQGSINGLMIGVGAGFGYYAGNVKRAPQWMQKCNCGVVVSFDARSKRLFKRYFHTNIKFIFTCIFT